MLIGFGVVVWLVGALAGFVLLGAGIIPDENDMFGGVSISILLWPIFIPITIVSLPFWSMYKLGKMWKKSEAGEGE